ncbi:MAG: 16S rRNA (cytidine(1402)-2'-O)-methyltransferase [Leptospirillia bacterium]
MKDPCGTLFVIGTPIGNLEDLSLRALRLLGTVDIIAAEDTRHTQKLLTHHGLSGQLTSYHDHNKEMKAPVLVERMLSGESVALVSDAGTPLVSDPGYLLVVQAHEADIPVVPVPGPSAVHAALSVAGLATDAYTFLGYLPNRSGARRTQLERLKEQPYTLVLFESPHRIGKCLADILEVMGDRPLAICRELTKVHEEVLRTTVSGAIERFAEGKVRGEFTLVLEGFTRKARQQARREEKAQGRKPRPRPRPRDAGGR